jgi:putative membrane protein
VRRGAVFRLGDALLAAALAALLDLAIEPVAAYIEHYWQWSKPDLWSYYGVPLANFVSWFVVAFVLLLLVGRLLAQNNTSEALQREKIERKYIQKRRSIWRLVLLTPRILFCCSLFMFGLVDLTHSYYWATLLAVLAGTIIYLRR